MSTFILAPGPNPLPPSADLNLLPFALTPTPGTAPIGAFFRPRPAPAGHAVPEGTPIAAFRGRQVVGQRIELPRGYKGVVLRAHGGGAGAGAAGGAVSGASTSSSANATARQRYPLTPAPSASSIASVPATTTRSTRAATRARGAGQVALARPRTRAAGRVKRIKMDDEDDDGEEDDATVVKPIAARPRPAPTVERAPEVPHVPVNAAAAPHEAADVDMAVEAEVEMAVETVEVAAVADEAVDEGNDDSGAPVVEETVTVTVTQTETRIATDETAAVSASEPTYAYDDDADGVPTRLLVPTASFSSFTLWTPDAGLAGFVADEKPRAAGAGAAAGETGEKDQGGAERKPGTTMTAETAETTETTTTGTTETATQPGAQTTALRKSWWRQGGAGEGGDEFVRALGEWIGLNEIIHERCYPCSDDGDEDEE